MNDIEQEQQIARIRALSEKWIDLLGLNHWRIEVQYSERPLEPVSDKARGDGSTVLMTTWARWEYGRAAISVDLEEAARLDDDDLEECFLHELMHVFLNEARHIGCEDGAHHEDHVATTLARAFLWVWQEAGKNAGVDNQAG